MEAIDLGDGVSLYIGWGPSFLFERDKIRASKNIIELRVTAEGERLSTDPRFAFVTPAMALKAFEIWMADLKVARRIADMMGVDKPIPKDILALCDGRLGRSGYLERIGVV